MDIKELPPDVDSLLHRERGLVPAAPAGARDRVRSRLESTLGLPAAVPQAAAVGAATSGGPVGSSGARWAVAAVLGAVAVAGVYLALRQPAPVASRSDSLAGVLAPQAAVGPGAPGGAGLPSLSSSAPAPAVAPVTTLAAPPSAAATMALALVDRARGPRLRRAAAGPAAESDDDLRAEQTLLDDARHALDLGEPGRTLAATRLHERRFPRGQLIEERESLVVRALMRSGRPDDARARAEAFRRRHPRSMFLPAVDAVLAQPGF